jgi:hypothetical protein
MNIVMGEGIIHPAARFSFVLALAAIDAGWLGPAGCGGDGKRSAF